MSQRPRILLIDDDPSILELGQFILDRSGFDVDTATDGSVGWQALREKQYDAVVTDNLMPNVTGLALLKLMNDAKIRTPVIMITGTIPSSEFLRASHLQLEAILQKPVSVEQFLAILRPIVARLPDR